jgi:hypothetical protein
MFCSEACEFFPQFGFFLGIHQVRTVLCFALVMVTPVNKLIPALGKHLNNIELPLEKSNTVASDIPISTNAAPNFTLCNNRMHELLIVPLLLLDNPVNF